MEGGTAGCDVEFGEYDGDFGREVGLMLELSSMMARIEIGVHVRGCA